eukprot:jgi/Ulvmu1/1345/UM011_0073.1
MASPSTVQLELIEKLEADGLLTPEDAALARERHVSHSGAPFDTATRSASLFTISNCAKAFGVFVLLLALATFIGLLTPWLAKAPVEIYQAPMLALALGATLHPRLIWPAQAGYVALLATFSTFIISIWIVGSHDAITAFLDDLDDRGWPVATILSAIAMTYFLATALLHRSHALTLASAVAFTTALTTADPEPALARSTAGHLLALALHIAIKTRGTHPKQTYLFTYAAEYYCTIALGITLWIGSIAYDRPGLAILYSAIFSLIYTASCMTYQRLSIKTPFSILTCFAVGLTLTWLQYWTHSAGAVVSLVVCGVTLFGFGLLLDRHRHFLVFELPKAPPEAGTSVAARNDASAVAMPMIGEGPAVVSVGSVGSGRLDPC